MLCLAHIWKRVFNVSKDMFTLYLKKCLHYVWRLITTMFIQCLKTYIYTPSLEACFHHVFIHSICICMFVLSLNIFFHYVLTLSLNICFHYVCLKMFLYPIWGHFYTIFKDLFLPCLKAMFTQFWIKDQNIFSEAYYLLDFLTKQNFWPNFFLVLNFFGLTFLGA